MVLPNLIVVGERRCGTTFLSQRLAAHPEIFLHPKRDRGYFIDDDARHHGACAPWKTTHSVEQYRAFFRDAGAGNQSVICEKSADYLFWRSAHRRMTSYLPDAKYIVILRHPVRRAISHYWIEVGKKRESADLSTAIARDLAGDTSDPYVLNHLSYVRRGQYAENIQHLLSFIDRDRLFVVALEDLIKWEAKVMEMVFSFVGVDSMALPTAGEEKKNRNWVMLPKPWARSGIAGTVASGYAKAIDTGLKLAMRNRDRRRLVAASLKSPMFDRAGNVDLDAKLEHELRDLYAKDIGRLETLLGQSFSDWGF